MSNHTQGPWTVISDPAHFDSLTTVVAGSVTQNKTPNAQMIVQVGGWASVIEAQSNARLIAAAPELLAFVEEYIYAYESGMAGESYLHRIAKTAITKATGGKE